MRHMRFIRVHIRCAAESLDKETHAQHTCCDSAKRHPVRPGVWPARQQARPAIGMQALDAHMRVNSCSAILAAATEARSRQALLYCGSGSAEKGS